MALMPFDITVRDQNLVVMPLNMVGMLHGWVQEASNADRLASAGIWLQPTK